MSFRKTAVFVVLVIMPLCVHADSQTVEADIQELQRVIADSHIVLPDKSPKAPRTSPEQLQNARDIWSAHVKKTELVRKGAQARLKHQKQK